MIKHHSSRWWSAWSALPDPPLHIVPSLTGMSVTSETTFMNSSLIINVEDGGLAFDLAWHRCALYSAWRRKPLLIYEDTLPLCVTSYLVLLPRGEQSVNERQSCNCFWKTFVQNLTGCVYCVYTGLNTIQLFPLLFVTMSTEESSRWLYLAMMSS